MTLVEAYEAEHFPIDLPDPVEAIKFRMEQAGLAPKDLVPAIGRLNRVYEILNHKRPLTLNMIWRLHEKFGIPAESLNSPHPSYPLLLDTVGSAVPVKHPNLPCLDVVNFRETDTEYHVRATPKTISRLCPHWASQQRGSSPKQ